MPHTESELSSNQEDKSLAIVLEQWNEPVTSLGYQYRRGFEDALELILHRILHMTTRHEDAQRQFESLYVSAKSRRLDALEERLA